LYVVDNVECFDQIFPTYDLPPSQHKLFSMTKRVMQEMAKFAQNKCPEMLVEWRGEIGKLSLLKADELFNAIYEPFLLSLGKPIDKKTWRSANRNSVQQRFRCKQVVNIRINEYLTYINIDIVFDIEFWALKLRQIDKKDKFHKSQSY